MLKALLPVECLYAFDMDLYQVRVDSVETHQNVKDAKKFSYTNALKQAYGMLKKRVLVSPLNDEEDIDAQRFVLSYQIEQEKFSHTTYIATYKFQFDPQVLAKYFDAQNIPFLKKFCAPTLVIPILERFVFHEENTWLHVWEEALPFSRTRLVLPEGNIQDFGFGEDLLYEERAAQGVQGLLQRYPAHHVAVFVFSPLAKILHITLYDTKGDPTFQTSLKLEQDTLIYVRDAAIDALNILANKYIMGSQDAKNLSCVMHFNRLDQLTPLFQYLKRTGENPHLHLLKLDANNAFFSIDDDQHSFLSFFEKQNFKLTQHAHIWHAHPVN